MIESTIIGWISGETDAGARVSVGNRLQSTELPAIVVEMPSGIAASIGSAPISRYEVVFNCIAATMAQAQGIADDVENIMKAEAPGGNKCAITTSYGVLQEPTIGDGSEQEPAICTLTMEIFYKA
jgi:hypothetical protein